MLYGFALTWMVKSKSIALFFHIFVHIKSLCWKFVRPTPPLVSNCQHLAYPPSSLCQQWSAFGLPPLPPPAADEYVNGSLWYWSRWYYNSQIIIMIRMTPIQVIINLQQTPRDGEATLRIFSNTDPALEVNVVMIITMNYHDYRGILSSWILWFSFHQLLGFDGCSWFTIGGGSNGEARKRCCRAL